MFWSKRRSLVVLQKVVFITILALLYSQLPRHANVLLDSLIPEENALLDNVHGATVHT